MLSEFHKKEKTGLRYNNVVEIKQYYQYNTYL